MVQALTGRFLPGLVTGTYDARNTNKTETIAKPG